MLFVIIAICLILVVLVLLLVDALINDSDPVTLAPGVGMNAGEDADAGQRIVVDAALPPVPLPARSLTEQKPRTATDELSLEESKRRLARNLRDPELRKIPLMTFPEQKPERIDGKPAIVLYSRPPMPLIISPGSEVSIVEEINEILQKNLAGTPLARRDIRLIESPSKGVWVKVGPRLFDGIEAVTDPDVKAAVQAAAAAWEAEQ